MAWLESATLSQSRRMVTGGMREAKRGPRLLKGQPLGTEYVHPSASYWASQVLWPITGEKGHPDRVPGDKG